jgi:hypothetical protein
MENFHRSLFSEERELSLAPSGQLVTTKNTTNALNHLNSLWLNCEDEIGECRNQKKGDDSLGVVSGWCRDSLDNQLSSIAAASSPPSIAPRPV